MIDRRLAALLPLVPLLACTDPAQALPPPPSPCSWYVPTGEPLPRQDTVKSNTFLTAEAGTTYRSQRIANVMQGEPVAVLQECGGRLRVRTVRQEVGWIGTGMLPKELRLYEAAKKRPPATDADCARHYLDEPLIERCRADLAQRTAYAAEVKTAPKLTASEIPAYLSGQTLTLAPRAADSTDDPKHPPTLFFAADGEVFLRQGESFRWRGRWTVEQDALCLPGAGMSCVRFRKIDGGRVVWVPTSGAKEFFATRSAGDSAGIVPFVTEAYPRAKPPPAPKGSEPFAMPSLGGL